MEHRQNLRNVPISTPVISARLQKIPKYQGRATLLITTSPAHGWEDVELSLHIGNGSNGRSRQGWAAAQIVGKNLQGKGRDLAGKQYQNDRTRTLDSSRAEPNKTLGLKELLSVMTFSGSRIPCRFVQG